MHIYVYDHSVDGKSVQCQHETRVWYREGYSESKGYDYIVNDAIHNTASNITSCKRVAYVIEELFYTQMN